MKILEVQEQKDGSAILSIDLTDKEVELFVEYAIVDILKRKLKLGEYKEDSND